MTTFPEPTGTDPAVPRAEPFRVAASEDRGSGTGPAALDAAGPTYVPVAAAEAMLAVRHDQIFRFGHTPEKDLQVGLDEFGKHLRRLATSCTEDLQFRVSPEIAQRHMAKLGALAMAIFDRLEAEKGKP